MADIVDQKTRSRMMSRIRGSNTKPEVRLRKALHAEGFRFRVNVRRLPGTPDIVLSKWNTAILVHGCFWHTDEVHRKLKKAKKQAAKAEREARKMAAKRGGA